ncbi:MAG: cytidine deaminase [Erythrobacter sp.]|nr:MAG: cytidine deaminase [Erythrobacter sp.]
MSDWSALVEAAKAARSRAYAPYSDFLVGCAIESRDGQVALGANLENACYRLGVCAEQSALAAAQQAFGLENVARLAIVGGPREGADKGEPVTPCGGCRQAIMEAANRAGTDLAIVCCDASGTERLETSIAALLPAAFDLDPR